MTATLRPRPRPGVTPRSPFPRFERSRLANGVTLLVCHMPMRPLIQLRVVIDGGVCNEPAELPGLAALAAAGLAEGTVDRSAEELAVALESLGSTLGSSASWPSTHINVDALAATATRALGLAFEVITAPGHREEDLARLGARMATGLVSAERMPNGRANLKLNQSMFQSGARMALPVVGTPETLTTTGSGRVRRFWAETASPSRCTVMVVGDLGGVDVPAAVAATFEEWAPIADMGPVSCPPNRPTNEPGIAVIDLPGAPQTTIAFGAATEPVPIAERAALRVGWHYLGGFFGSRLQTALREEKNISYGIGGTVDHRGPATVTVGGTSVQTDATGEAVSAVIAEYEQAANGEIEVDRFQEAVNHLVRTTAVNRRSARAVADSLTHLVVHDLPDDYFDVVADAIAAMTPEAAAAALRSHAGVDRLRIAAVGDALAITEPLRRLGWGDLSTEPLFKVEQ